MKRIPSLFDAMNIKKYSTYIPSSRPILNRYEILTIGCMGTRQTVFRIMIHVMRLATFSGLHRLALSVPRLDHVGRKNVYWIYEGLKRRGTNSGH